MSHSEDDTIAEGVGIRPNPRNLPCPSCRQPDKLTKIDVRNSYLCDQCVDSNVDSTRFSWG
jgi:hypothetical protein